MNCQSPPLSSRFLFSDLLPSCSHTQDRPPPVNHPLRRQRYWIAAAVAELYYTRGLLRQLDDPLVKSMEDEKQTKTPFITS